jgi:hypothetical protein
LKGSVAPERVWFERKSQVHAWLSLFRMAPVKGEPNNERN